MKEIYTRLVHNRRITQLGKTYILFFGHDPI